MQELEEKLNSSLDLVRVEIKEAKVLPSSYIEALKHIVGSDFNPRSLYYNSTCLITTDFDDAEYLKSKLQDCDVILKVESEYFGIGFYFFNFIKNKTLMNLIGGIS